MAGPHWQRDVISNTTNASQALLVESQPIGRGDSQNGPTSETSSGSSQNATDSLLMCQHWRTG